ncbi:helix-turn-helix domain-containing protein [Microbacterium sp. LRZ72]|uniref:helix-turn-helix domain-containing protein n=1 Tax=Microbacterium sp. LRZ72 TaxID=2942481 RepID=UPI0029ABBE82|nr:helix-turn-helix domain-containing protein [Microbacterium sp. LRZ72]MDX2377708.1 helix-turn-helix domain-containing protein [Microbacterium sp. LRZ72]
MPKLVKPANSERAAEAVTVLGNLGKASLIAYLRRNPNAGRKAISEAIEVPPPTLVRYLRELEEAGVLIGDPPRSDRKQGEWPVYRVNNAVVTDLYLQLGQEIGEI